ncbi:MAG: hypothetical protein HQL82_09690 [Magnetococcales bacterium]|nr:hypothetical protein [Magnetococcales bacterium]
MVGIANTPVAEAARQATGQLKRPDGKGRQSLPATDDPMGEIFFGDLEAKAAKIAPVLVKNTPKEFFERFMTPPPSTTS